MNLNDVAPRMGFAYAILPKLVLRGGYGWYYSRNFYGGSGPDPGYSPIDGLDFFARRDHGDDAARAGILNRSCAGDRERAGGLTNVGQGGGGVDPYRPDPRTKQFMFGFQYAFTPNDVLDVDYVGTAERA